jgi:hypothetical protein
MAGLAGGGLLGAGALGGLGKMGKWFKFPKIASVGTKILTKVKDPKVAIPLVLGAVVASGFGLSKMLGGKEEEEQGLEGRAKGGSTLVGKSYIVGENGPEIFTPKENGTIIPNNKIGTHKPPVQNNKMMDKLKLLFKDSNETLSKKMKNVWAGYSKPFTKTIKNFSNNVTDNIVEFKEGFLEGTANLFQSFKEYIVKMLPSWIKNAPKAISDFTKRAVKSVSEYASSAYDAVVSTISPAKKEELAPTSKLKLQSPVEQQKNILDINLNAPKLEAPKVASKTESIMKIPKVDIKPEVKDFNIKNNINFQNIGYNPPSNLKSRAIGEYKVKKTEMFNIHKDEMVIPKVQSEMIRSAIELKNEYNVNPVSEVKTEEIDEAFWINKFVPAFAKAIKVDRSKNRVIKNVIANPFGA